jgi:AraC-like DNA-binding protein
LLPRLSSEKSGPISFYPDGHSPFLQTDGWEYYAAAAPYPIWLQIYPGNQVQIELYLVQATQADRIRFSDLLLPHLLISLFGRSCFLAWDGSPLRPLHDRGCSYIQPGGKDYTINLPSGGYYLISFIHWTEAFYSFLDKKPKPAPHHQPVILNKEGIERLSTLFFSPDHPDLGDFIQEELLRVFLRWYVTESARSSFQPIQLSPEEVNIFYEERDRVLAIVQKHLSFQEILRTAGISNIYLFRKRLKQLYGLNIRSFLTEARLAKAASLLKSPELSIKQIASLTGFVNVSYFTRVFTRYFQQTPRSFQQGNDLPRRK